MYLLTNAAFYRAVMKIPFVTKELIHTKGANIQLEEANLERLADICIESFAMVAALSRASRYNTLVASQTYPKLSSVLKRSFKKVLMINHLICLLRSYIVGHAHAEHEVNLAISYIHEAR